MMPHPAPTLTPTVVPLTGPKLYTLAEAAQILRCSTDTVMRRIDVDLDLAAASLAAGQSMSATAKLLGVSRRTLRRRMAVAVEVDDDDGGVSPAPPTDDDLDPGEPPPWWNDDDEDVPA